jgi:hypothetical protein
MESFAFAEKHHYYAAFEDDSDSRNERKRMTPAAWPAVENRCSALELQLVNVPGSRRYQRKQDRDPEHINNQ